MPKKPTMTENTPLIEAFQRKNACIARALMGDDYENLSDLAGYTVYRSPRGRWSMSDGKWEFTSRELTETNWRSLARVAGLKIMEA